MRHYLLLLLTAWGLSGCASARLSGVFLETKPNAILFDSKEVRLYPDGRVIYLQHSDMVGSGQHAAGTYRLRGGWLTLRVRGPVAVPAPHADARPLPADSAQVVVRVFSNQLDAPPKPWAFATVVLYDAAGSIIDGISCDESGRAVLPLRASPRPHRLGVQGFGAPGWQQPWPATPTAYDVMLSPNIGQPLPAGTRFRLKILRRHSDTLWLPQGPETLMLVRQPR